MIGDPLNPGITEPFISLNTSTLNGSATNGFGGSTWLDSTLSLLSEPLKFV